MNRRGFIGSLLAIPIAKFNIESTAPKKWGLMTVERCWRLRDQGIDLRPYLNGEHVDECFEADDEQGYVIVYATGDDGHKYFDHVRNCVPMLRRYGDVEFRRVAAGTPF